MFACSANFGWKRQLLNFKSAFAKESLTEYIYLRQPKRFVQIGKNDQVYVLQKSFLTLWQTSCKWNFTFAQVFDVLWSRKVAQWPCCLYLAEPVTICNVRSQYRRNFTFYSNYEPIRKVIAHLQSYFEIGKNEKTEQFLAFTVENCDKCVKLQNILMIWKLSVYSGMHDRKLVKLPLQMGLDFIVNDGRMLKDNSLYGKMIGSLFRYQTPSRLHFVCRWIFVLLPPEPNWATLKVYKTQS